MKLLQWFKIKHKVYQQTKKELKTINGTSVLTRLALLLKVNYCSLFCFEDFKQQKKQLTKHLNIRQNSNNIQQQKVTSYK